MKTYTVIGYSRDNHQRWCDSVEAEDPADAERKVSSAIMICGVAEGKVPLVDSEQQVSPGGRDDDDEAAEDEDEQFRR